ncbi:MAG TPA: hypothetical protein VL860_02985 [Planctomycetota bacterium]|nr:hypothetical protein [Planctomycetota bacterium]
MKEGSAQEPELFAPLAIADAPLAPRPALKLPAGLAVGSNRYQLENAAPGCKLLADGAVADITAAGEITVVALRPGHVQLTLVGPDDAVLQRLSADVHRALLINATVPFDSDLTRAISVELQLTAATPADKPVQVQLQAIQKGIEIGAVTLTMASGSKQIELPIHDAQAGEIHLRAIASIPLTDQAKIEIGAHHWCVRGQTADDFNKFRDDLIDPEKLAKTDAPSLYRAALVDAWNYYRLLQAGDGRYRTLNRQGKLGFTEWNYGSCYISALLYTADWPENPYKGDKRFLESAAMGLDAGLDPQATFLAGGHSRHLRPFLLTYELIKDQVAASRREYWKERLLALTSDIVTERLEPATHRYTMYSEDVGTGTNHFAFYTAGVFQAGRIFDRPDWTRLAAATMGRLAEHGRDGQFPERPGISATHYTWLTMNALGEYYEDTKDPAILALLQKCVAYSVATSLPDCNTLLLHDGRNNDYGTYDFGDFVLTLTPEGRALARARALRHIGATHKPGDSGPEYWWRAAENAQFAQAGPAVTPNAPDAPPSEFTFLDGRALIARNGGFIYGLSAVHLQPTDRQFWVDPQNVIELHHAIAGPILCGANSQAQPEAGSFMRTLGDANHTVVFMPQDGSLVKTEHGHAAVLDYGTFTVKVTIEKLPDVADKAGSFARVQVDLLSVQGPEPVTFNFFPGVHKSEDCTLSADGKTLTFGKVKITTTAPVTVEKDFKIINPYNLKRTTAVKPIRAHVDLNPLKSVVLTIHVE